MLDAGSPNAGQAKKSLESLHENIHDMVQKSKEREQATTWWFTAGLVGFVVLVSGDLGAVVMKDAPLILTSIMLTLTVGAGVTLVSSRASLRSSIQKANNLATMTARLDELIEEHEASIHSDEISKIMKQSDREADSTITWRRLGDTFYNISLLLTLL